jgi:hypothetical protein
VQLVSVLSQHGMKHRLRAAREALAARFPLPEHLWTPWLNDAISDLGEIVTPEELVALAKRSTEDYLSCPLWQNYLQCAFACLQSRRSCASAQPLAAAPDITALWQNYLQSALPSFVQRSGLRAPAGTGAGRHGAASARATCVMPRRRAPWKGTTNHVSTAGHAKPGRQQRAARRAGS